MSNYKITKIEKNNSDNKPQVGDIFIVRSFENEAFIRVNDVFGPMIYPDAVSGEVFGLSLNGHYMRRFRHRELKNLITLKPANGQMEFVYEE